MGKDANNIAYLLQRIGTYIKQHSIKLSSKAPVPQSISFNKKIIIQFALKSKSTRSTLGTSMPNLILSSSTMPLLSAIPLVVSTLYILQVVIPPTDVKVNFVSKKVLKLFNVKKSYTQASKANISPNVKDVLWIKAFPALIADEVGRMIKAKNSNKRQKKLKINITTKEPSRKQVIIPIVKSNAELIINSTNQHITNINKSLKEIKSDIHANFICIINNRVIITINKIVNASDLKIIEKCIKNTNNINLETTKSPWLLKSKSYLKIIGLPYMGENSFITPDIIFKKTYIFNNIVLASKSCIIKASLKSDIAVV